MLEIIVECWRDAADREDFLWSVWRDGGRVEMGGPHEAPEVAEAEARRYCRDRLGTAPDRVTRL